MQISSFFFLSIFFFLLISAFADNLESTTTEGDLIPSLLLESVVNGDVDGISRALESGESIDLVNDKGWSAAMFAVNLGDMEILRALIEQQIDLNNPDNEGKTPLMAAAALVISRPRFKQNKIIFALLYLIYFLGR